MLSPTGWFLLLLASYIGANDFTEIRMPGAEPALNDSYLCTAFPVDSSIEHYIVNRKRRKKFESPICRDCGEMTDAGPNFDKAPICYNKPNILYAWGRDAPELHLPKGVSFQVGGNSDIQYIVLQVHYMKKLEQDFSGVTVESTVEPTEKTASTLLMVTGGTLPPKKRETFETACIVDEDVELHPFAIRPHTHRHGEMVSGWVVREDANGNDEWELIGERNPQLPQMFQTVNKNITIRRGDMIAARCVMNNKENKEIVVGNTDEDEMCNYYIMYWVWGDNVLRDNTCYSPGPPDYYWSSDAGLNNIPKI